MLPILFLQLRLIFLPGRSQPERAQIRETIIPWALGTAAVGVYASVNFGESLIPNLVYGALVVGNFACFVSSALSATRYPGATFYDRVTQSLAAFR